MKRIMLKFATLLVLVTAGFLVNDNSPVKAASCWETAYNKWMSCDNSYSNTVYQHTYVDNNNNNIYCQNNSTSNCSASAANFCSSQASTTCANDPNYSTCYNNSYSSCYLPAYQSCHTSTYDECATNVETRYNNRGSAYVSCLGAEGNATSCVEQLAGFCQDANDRAASCSNLYSGSEDYDAYNTCRANSGIDRCQ